MSGVHCVLTIQIESHTHRTQYVLKGFVECGFESTWKLGAKGITGLLMVVGRELSQQTPSPIREKGWKCTTTEFGPVLNPGKLLLLK